MQNSSSYKGAAHSACTSVSTSFAVVVSRLGYNGCSSFILPFQNHQFDSFVPLSWSLPLPLVIARLVFRELPAEFSLDTSFIVFKPRISIA